MLPNPSTYVKEIQSYNIKNRVFYSLQMWKLIA